MLFFIRGKEPGSSVSIVSDYGLDDRAIGDRSPAGAKDFSSNLCVQTGSGAHPASCIMGTGGPFPGAKRGRGVTLTTHPHLVPRSRMCRSHTTLPPSACMTCSGTAFLIGGKQLFIGRRNGSRRSDCGPGEDRDRRVFTSKLVNSLNPSGNYMYHNNSK
jgi:hypothetical protein